MHQDEHFPQLTAKHFSNGRLFADRSDMLLALRPQSGLVFGEVGVANGTFSSFVLTTMRPSRFVAIDLFDLHTKQNLWGMSPQDMFGGHSHRAYYEQHFAWAGDAVLTMEGPSHSCLAACEDAYFDILYLDADHSYDAVKRDIQAGARKVKQGGLFVFNDYVLQDHLGYDKFGVVRAVNELVIESDWRVVGFSLQRHMYCDIALQRA